MQNTCHMVARQSCTEVFLQVAIYQLSHLRRCTMEGPVLRSGTHQPHGPAGHCLQTSMVRENVDGGFPEGDEQSDAHIDLEGMLAMIMEEDGLVDGCDCNLP